ncbi:MAG: hypothetical protein R3F33_00600 [Planctomycetota bacterium]
MTKRRGFFAEIQHQSKLAQREQERNERASEKRARAAQKEAERLKKEEARAIREAERASAKEQRVRESEAKKAHAAAQEAEANRLNIELEAFSEEAETLLSTTLEVDDYVDLESLRIREEAPQYPSPDLDPFDAGPPIPKPPLEPTLVLPEKPSGLVGLLKGASYRRSVSQVEANHADAMRDWEAQMEAHQITFNERAKRAQDAWLAQAKERNSKLDTLISNLAYGVAEAVHEYISIVLANSIYPSWLNIEYDYTFLPGDAELTLLVLVPRPPLLPAVQSYKYAKSTDTIAAKEYSLKAQKERYLSIVNQVALRTLHEIFEADRRELIQAVSLTVATHTVDPATGNETDIPFLAVAVDRKSFMSLNLARVDPNATLNYLGASFSKSPFDLVPADTSGVRRV